MKKAGGEDTTNGLERPQKQAIAHLHGRKESKRTAQDFGGIDGEILMVLNR